jgi:hypothetical protein
VTNSRTLKNTLTDKDGGFVLKNVAAGDSIVVSFIGYQARAIKVGAGKAALTIPLEKGKMDLKEVVITSHSNNLTTSRTLKYEIGLAIENLFNQGWNESQFEYTSRLKYETQPVDEVSYTPGVPFFAKVKLAVFF